MEFHRWQLGLFGGYPFLAESNEAVTLTPFTGVSL